MGSSTVAAAAVGAAALVVAPPAPAALSSAACDTRRAAFQTLGTVSSRGRDKVFIQQRTQAEQGDSTLI